jgi:hypothetical protein
MAYIGKTPVIGNFQVCDAITVVDAQAAYTMQVSGVNVSPESANHMLVSLNGILQAPTSSFTVSGSTITFASNLETGDVIDFIQILGNVLDLGVPSDDTVTTAKIVDANVTAAKMFSGFANGITEADMWRLTTTIIGTNADITANLERVDDASFAKIGTGVTPSSGIFSFPSTGLWLIGSMISIGFGNQADNNTNVTVKATINNSTYDDISFIAAGSNSSSNNSRFSVFKQNYLNVTNTSNVKVKFTTGSMEAASEVIGSTAINMTAFSFIRLGDSQ